MSHKNKCKDCKFITKKKGSMPKNRVCEVTPLPIWKDIELRWILEVNPESIACDSFVKRGPLKQTNKTQEKINNAQ